ncbi:MAG: TIGR04053 family radical SAM/SPASM domain-containing protein, partial [Polyangiaceae bacterium]
MNDPDLLSRVRPNLLDFDDHPLLAIWETTQACDLVCAHCRACATPHLDPRELSTTQGKKLLSQLAEMGTPLCVLTGGDPAKRADLVELVEHGANAGLVMALTPSGTPLMTEQLLVRLKEARLARVAVSVDGPTAAMHDAFRGVDGSFAESLRILRQARAIGLETQINFTLSRASLAELDAMAELTRDVGASMLVVFVVIPTGRATAALTLNADEIEAALTQFARIGETVPFQIKTTGAPQLRRILMQRSAKTVPTGLLRDVHDGVVKGPRGVTDGVGFLFISHTGDVYPSGFLPVSAGNVKIENVGRLYRESPLFRSLRDADSLGGKCGVCPFRRVCGGSRARAYAETGVPNAEDPGCSYVPRGYVPLTPAGGEPAKASAREDALRALKSKSSGGSNGCNRASVAAP